MRRISIAALFLILAVGPTAAWGPTGHRVTGAIAELYLSPEARIAIQQILGTESLAEASTWPDFMRSSPDEFWQGRRSKSYHYVTRKVGQSTIEPDSDDNGRAFTALSQYRADLKDPGKSLAEKQHALRFIVHIVGDLHQPLHVGNGTDLGGNEFKVTYFGRSTNLHRVWDEDIVDRQKLSYSELTTWLRELLKSAKSRSDA
jgi:hypothetical protein